MGMNAQQMLERSQPEYTPHESEQSRHVCLPTRHSSARYSAATAFLALRKISSQSSSLADGPG